MKLGLISDIHANIDNLRRALVLLREEGAETILCAGDLVDGETEGNAVAQLIKAQNIPAVQGNHDHALIEAATYADDWLKNWDEASFGPPPWRYSDDAVSDDTVAFLRDLPLTRRFEWDDKRVLMAHASPWDQITYIYANGRREYFERIDAESEADVVILGHTHMPMAVRAKNTWVLNPGSVDGNRHDPYNSTCALLDLAEMHYRVLDIHTQRPVVYERTRFN
jgi:putative phosphoesterase